MNFVIVNGIVGGFIGYLIWEIIEQRKEIKKLREIRRYIDENGNEFSIRIAEIERIMKNNKRDE